MKVRWITYSLGTASWAEAFDAHDSAIVDVRALRDGLGNSMDLLRQKIFEICDHLRAGHRTVVCCDHGMSRSNALAAAALASLEQRSLDSVLLQVIHVTGQHAIKSELLADIREALGESPPSDIALDPSRVLLLGATRFPGSSLCQLLASEFSMCTMQDERTVLLRPAHLEIKVHASNAKCILFTGHPEVTDSVCGLGKLLIALRNALEICRAQGRRFIFLSSNRVFEGHHAFDAPVKEDEPACPNTPYGEALFLAEQLIELYGRCSGLDALVVRTGIVYGNSDNRPGFLQTFIRQALRNNPIVTHCYHNGSPFVDLLHVTDFAEGLSCAIRRGLSGLLHLGSKTGISTFELANLIVRIAGSHSMVERVSLRGIAPNVILDSSRALGSLGWRPRITLEQGLGEVVAILRTPTT